MRILLFLFISFYIFFDSIVFARGAILKHYSSSGFSFYETLSLIIFLWPILLFLLILYIRLKLDWFWWFKKDRKLHVILFFLLFFPLIIFILSKSTYEKIDEEYSSCINTEYKRFKNNMYDLKKCISHGDYLLNDLKTSIVFSQHKDCFNLAKYFLLDINFDYKWFYSSYEEWFIWWVNKCQYFAKEKLSRNLYSSYLNKSISRWYDYSDIDWDMLQNLIEEKEKWNIKTFNELIEILERIDNK